MKNRVFYLNQTQKIGKELQIKIITFVTLFFLLPVQAQNYSFRDTSLSIEERVNSIVSILTPAEKLSLLRQNEPAISRLGLRPFTYWTEGLHGIGWGQSGTLTGTQFPQAFGLGETWDEEIMRRIGAQVGREARAIYNSGKCGLVLRAPNCDLIRDPRWGRTEESYGEDPFHVGKLSSEFVKGLRGNDPKYFMIASMCKHFVANTNEANRMSSSSNFDQRNLLEYYAKPFEFALMEGGAQAYMTAYNAVNNVHCIYNTELKRVSRQIWGWDGAVCSDNYDLIQSPGYSTMAQKAAAAVKNASIGSFDDPQLGNAPEDAFSQGLMSISDIDYVIKNTMRVRARLGDLNPESENPFKSITGTPWTSDSAKSLARLVTQKSIVLLKNADNILPLDKAALKSIAIIGSIADSVARDWYGGYPPYKIPARAGITTKVGTGVQVNFAADNSGNAAVNAAKSSDIAIVFLGNHPTCAAGWDVCNMPSEGKEGIDRKQLNLEPIQDSLIRQVYRANPKTIVVLISSFPYTINWINENVPGIVHLTHSSQETGSALADVLFGDYNPAGRLNMTWPKSLSDLPDMMDYNIRNGRTYMYCKTAPLYSFGYGLSYTTFSYENLTTSTGSFCQGTLDVNVDVTNTGNRSGEEVVQLYVKYHNSSIPRPVKQLRGFKRVAIAAGATSKVSIPLSFKDLAYWDSTQSKWTVESGTVQIFVGGSSADSALKITKDITVCGGVVDVANDNKNKGSLFAQEKRNRFFAITNKGISFYSKAHESYEINVYNLKGNRIWHLKGTANTAGIKNLQLTNTSRIGASLYLVSGKIGGQEFSEKFVVGR